ncbi:hypothetical protein V6N12_063028 [Hibiscus sabdariffa]|uniref:Uncharacterized protein n=1 Tax=Hibiscus sabdariffa TaxID=183260 RepID=A0ABR2FAM6_9ROSI
MLDNGNLMQYPAVPYLNTDGIWYSYWQSATFGAGATVSLNLTGDGRLYLLNSTGVVKNLFEGLDTREETLYLMKLDTDGIFRIYSYKLNQNRNRSIIYESLQISALPRVYVVLMPIVLALNKELNVHARQDSVKYLNKTIPVLAVKGISPCKAARVMIGEINTP